CSCSGCQMSSSFCCSCFFSCACCCCYFFPTRRSSDLYVLIWKYFTYILFCLGNRYNWIVFEEILFIRVMKKMINFWMKGKNYKRSEEHTSELQSRFDLVCRLLLEKKNSTNM